MKMTRECFDYKKLHEGVIHVRGVDLVFGPLFPALGGESVFEQISYIV